MSPAVVAAAQPALGRIAVFRRSVPRRLPMSVVESDAASRPDTKPARWRRLIPRSLFAQAMLIIVVGVAAAQSMAYLAIRYERDRTLRDLMMSKIERNLGSALAMLDRMPAGERATWVHRLDRADYSINLGAGARGNAGRTKLPHGALDALDRALMPLQVVSVRQSEGSHGELEIEVRMSDLSMVVVHLHPTTATTRGWLAWVLWLQLAALVASAWFSARRITDPMRKLADAADGLLPESLGTRFLESGPAEVVQAVNAINAMHARIRACMSERVEILGVITRDLEAPMARMRRHVDLMRNTREREHFHKDLSVMRALVQEGTIYAKTLHCAAEEEMLIDLKGMLSGMAADYVSVGKHVAFDGHTDCLFCGRVMALRRILMNLIDNALKFGREVRLHVERTSGKLVVVVLDDGPGIPEDQLQAVLRPFHRVETSRNRGTGGTGLGLAIAYQLALEIGAGLQLRNRVGCSGLEARLILPTEPELELGRKEQDAP